MRSPVLWAFVPIFSTVLFCAGLRAQSENDLTDDDILVLSPFEVNTSSDVGYRSTNSTSGTSLNTAIKDLPMALQVINREFIDDFAASDLDESLVYAAGVFTENNQASNSVGATRTGNSGDRSISSSAGGDRFANVVYIRGLATPFQNRMGFRYGGLVVTPSSGIALGGLLDSVNTERIEVVKGPNSLLYGVGVLTGIVNVIPKRPLSEPRYEFGIKAGSEDFLRLEADMTGPIDIEGVPGELNYRLAGSYEDRGNWTDFRNKSTEYWVAQLEYKPSRAAQLFLEYQQGNTHFDGIGSQWIYDDVNDAHDTEFRNEYDEGYAWARHEGTIDSLRRIDPTVFERNLSVTDQNGVQRNQAGFRLLDDPFVGGGLPDSYRITGPDTYAERDERNFIADFEFYPIDGLTINVGGFWSDQETFERNLQVNSGGVGNPISFYDTTMPTDTQLRGIWESGGLYGVSMQQSVRDVFGLNFNVDQTQYPGDWILPVTSDDVKLIEYWWRDRKVKSRSEQYRARVTYTFDAELFGEESTHTFLAGISYIRDDVDFPDGSINRANARSNPKKDDAGNYLYDDLYGGEVIASLDQSGVQVLDPYDNDGLYYRSIANFEPIYFDGRNDGVSGHNTVRDGDRYLNQLIEQTGFYGVYQGKFFQDRLEIIAGVRKDIYNAHQFTYKRVNISNDLLRDQALIAADGEASRIANSLGDPSLKDEILTQITSTDNFIANYYVDSVESGDEGYFQLANRGGAVDANYGIVPGSSFDVFERDIEVTTGTYGLSFDLTSDLTVYGVISQGISPNTALRDGNGDPIKAEETLNREIGIKFELWEKKLSGSLSYFEIDRENAIQDVPLAPSASNWGDAGFSTNRASDWTIPTYDPRSPTTYFVRSDYFVAYLAEEFDIDASRLNFAQQGNQVLQQVNLADLDPNLSTPQKLQKIREVQQKTLFPESFASQWNSQAPFGGLVQINLVGINTAGLDDLVEVTLYDPETDQFITRQISNMPIVYSAFMDRNIDQTKNGLLGSIHPIRYGRFDGFSYPQDNNNVDFSQSRGALVTYDEQIRGTELEFFFNPTKNLQFIFSYTHTEREAKNTFQFTEWQSIAGTEGSFVPPYTMLHREYGWESADITAAWVDYSAYSAELANAGDGKVAISALPEGTVEFLPEGTIDQTISAGSFNARTDAGQVLLMVDSRGDVINEANGVLAADFNGLISGVNLNFNPEDEAALWGKYTFDEDHGWLDNFEVSLGLKYIGPSATSVTFNSISPLSELTVTPEVKERYQVDCGFSYRWRWDDVDFRLSLNIYNLFDETYTVNTQVLDTLNPITGEKVTKRTEKFYAPTSFRVGLKAAF